MKKRILSVILTAAMVIGFIPASTAQTSVIEAVTAAEIVSRMGAGWNLGNTLDSHRSGSAIGYGLNTPLEELETAWARTLTTRELIDAVAAVGFTTLRIPVTWYKVADPDNDYAIREDWMQRVTEIADWGLANDMYVIVNVHHDEHAIFLDDNRIAHSELILRRYWQQISEAFRDYDERLIFEGLNEMRTIGSAEQWTGGTLNERQNLNRLQQAFVDTVRESGGNNAHRILMISTYAASADPAAFDGFVLPADTAENKLALSVHTYFPTGFCFVNRTPPAVYEWDRDNQMNTRGIELLMTRIATEAAIMGVPVILGEWGSVNKNNESARAAHAEFYAATARAHGMATVWWDNSGNGVGLPRDDGGHVGDGFALFNRATGEVLWPQIVDAIMRVIDEVEFPDPIPGICELCDLLSAPFENNTSRCVVCEGCGELIGTRESNCVCPEPAVTEPAAETTEPVPETTEPVPETTEPVPETTEPKPVSRPGDIDGDGVITINDALEVLKYLAGLDSAVDFEATIDDALEILKYLAGLPSLFAD
jgi:endoglucanase